MQIQKKLIAHINHDDIYSGSNLELFGFIFKIKKHLYGDWALENIGQLGDNPRFNEVITCHDDIYTYQSAWFVNTQHSDHDLMKLLKEGHTDVLQRDFNDEYPSLSFTSGRNVKFLDKDEFVRAINNSIDYVNTTYVADSTYEMMHSELMVSEKDNAMSKYISDLIKDTCDVLDARLYLEIGRWSYGKLAIIVGIDTERGPLFTVEEELSHEDFGYEVSSSVIKAKGLKMILTTLMTEGLSTLGRRLESSSINAQKQFIF